VRIVAGSLKGRAIVTPEGQGTRPTSDRARQAVFNVLEHAAWAEPLEGMRVMDLFAGSGALGFEAISRGAAFALFVETDDEARGAIRENADAYGVMGRTRVHRRSAIDLGVRPGSDGEAFDLAFLDPPYRKGLGEQTLARLIEGQWLRPGAVVVFERGSDEPEIDTPEYDRLDARDYGAARVLFLRLRAPDAAG
jgi:16S rRNA (guanine966-N2)-methyltransferase